MTQIKYRCLTTTAYFAVNSCLLNPWENLSIIIATGRLNLFRRFTTNRVMLCINADHAISLINQIIVATQNSDKANHCFVSGNKWVRVVFLVTAAIASYSHQRSITVWTMGKHRITSRSTFRRVIGRQNWVHKHQYVHAGIFLQLKYNNMKGHWSTKLSNVVMSSSNTRYMSKHMHAPL